MPTFGETGGPQLNISSPDGSITASIKLDENGAIIADGGTTNPKKMKVKGDGKEDVVGNQQICCALPFSANITWDALNGAIAELTLTGNAQIDNITNISDMRGDFTMMVVQDATGSRILTYGTNFKGTMPTLSTAANAIDVITFFVRNSTEFYVKDFKSNIGA